MTTETPLIEIFQRGARIGFVLDRACRGYEAFDASERSLGLFTCRRTAVRALRQEVENEE
jgi:hypothetical protein